MSRGRPQVTLESIWPELLEGVTILLSEVEQAAAKGLDSHKFMDLYTMVYNYCTTTRPRGRANAGNRYGANFVGEHLYERLKAFLVEHLGEIGSRGEGHTGENLLLFYTREWSRFTQAMRYINHVFSYLNRHWIKREGEDNKREVYPVAMLGLVVWRDELFLRIKQRLTHALLELIERERNGEQVNSALIRECVDAYVKLGLNKERPKEVTLEVYSEHFEAAFLSATELYYAQESSRFVAENTVSDYLRKVEARLEQEEGRARLFLHPATEESLKGVAEKALIKGHLETIQAEFESMLRNDKEEDMHRMFRLLGRVEGGLGRLKSVCERFIRGVGRDALEQLSKEVKVSPQAYCNCMLDTWRKYSSLVESAFEGDSGFVASLDKACRAFVNENAVTGDSAQKSPELLARYCDTLLKKGGDNHSEEEADALLSQVLTVFKYIGEKDVFLTFFSKGLAKRLIHETSASEELESSMIGKLKATCGFEYTSKLQRMFTDIGLSREVNQEFLAQLDEPLPLDFNVLVLATGSWPLSSPSQAVTLPPQLERVQRDFESFYLDSHSGRKLVWLSNHAKGEVRSKYLSKSYTFQCSTYQLAVLVQFEADGPLSYEQLSVATNLSGQPLDHVMYTLVRARVVIMDPPPAKVSNPEISAGASFTLNPKFKNKRLRVNINMKPRGQKARETDSTHAEINESRKLAVQACIVRIMKARKTMQHAQLISEVVAQLKDRFKVQIPLIKKSIDVLIEKEYLERDEKERGIYCYVA